ncbi:hypothetical protein DRQ53_03200 [bacterium]|nr:MAG: hypothetical protein DRQ53_03200 [bacterium]
MKSATPFAALLILFVVQPALAQVLVAHPDHFSIPLGEPLLVEFYGVLENDTLDDESAGELGATAELVTDVDFGSLVLNADGSFTYSPGVDFDGSDEFVYRASFGSVTSEAVVTLSACSGGPDVYTCWSESAFLDIVNASGYITFQEGFEDDLVWGDARTPQSQPGVSSRGILWKSNHTEPPTSNPISTTPGPPHTGLWAIYDPLHGYATGSELFCDVDDPDPECLYHDGFSGTSELGTGSLHGVGGYIDGSTGANVMIALDGAAPLTGGKIGGAHQFLGVIDTRPAGFTHFEFREVDGKVGQALFIFGDDFTLVTEQPTAVEGLMDTRVFYAGARPNPSGGSTTLYFSLGEPMPVRMAVFDLRGRLVRELVNERRGVGVHAVGWDGRDTEGRSVAAGVYFGRLVTGRGGVERVLTRKITIFR